MSGPKMRPLIPNRPGPYDRSDRFGGMVNRYAMGRGRNFRGNIYQSLFLLSIKLKIAEGSIY